MRGVRRFAGGGGDRGSVSDAQRPSGSGHPIRLSKLQGRKIGAPIPVRSGSPAVGAHREEGRSDPQGEDPGPAPPTPLARRTCASHARAGLAGTNLQFGRRRQRGAPRGREVPARRPSPRQAARRARGTSSRPGPAGRWWRRLHGDPHGADCESRRDAGARAPPLLPAARAPTCPAGEPRGRGRRAHLAALRARRPGGPRTRTPGRRAAEGRARRAQTR